MMRCNLKLPMGCRMRDLVRLWRIVEFTWGLLLIREMRHGEILV